MKGDGDRSLSCHGDLRQEEVAVGDTERRLEEVAGSISGYWGFEG